MTRAIDADYLMERLNRKKAGPANKRYTEGFNDCLMRVRSMVHSMPTLIPQNEWVSVEERLPEDNTQVLMWSAKWKIAEAGSYYNQHFWVYSEIGDGYIADNITHWMPLPLPPEKEE